MNIRNVVRKSALCLAVSSAFCLSLQNPAHGQDNQSSGKTSEREFLVQDESPPMPSPAAQAILVQSTIARLNDANLTGDYSVFLKRASTGFQQANSPEGLYEGFSSFRVNGIDLAPATLHGIRWTQSPTLTGRTLRLIGSIETRPQEITFDLGYVSENGWWRLAAVSVGLTPPVS